MSPIDLSSYNLGELKGLQHDIDKELKDRQRQDVQKARERILAIAQEVDVSVEQLIATGKKEKKEQGQKEKGQYKNPADDSQTWSGRGRKPKWIAEGLAGGKTLGDFRI